MSNAAKVHDLGFEDEDIVVGKSSNAEDAKFDQIIGCIEDIIMEEKFQDIQEKFMNKNYKHFEDSDENKLIYTTIHKDYINLIEKYLETQLQKRIEKFSMQEFMNNLMSRRDELDGEIFEILLTFEDFIEFKQMMLEYKASKEGRSLDLSMGICIQSLSFDPSSLSNSRAASNSRRNAPSDTKRTPLLDNAKINDEDDDDDLDTN